MTRGERNNNPLNIRRTKSKWLGMREEVKDKEFCEFKTLVWGFRAAFKLLQVYYLKHKCCTLRQIIRRWAPESENNTAAYIDSVCRAVQVTPDTLLNHPQKDKDLWCAIVQAMARVECARVFPASVIREAWELANAK